MPRDTNGPVKINGYNSVRDFKFEHHLIWKSTWHICVNVGTSC